MTGLPQPALTMMPAAMRAKHRARAQREIARYLCGVKWTDGFCEAALAPDCRCQKAAHAILAMVEGVGIVPVWEYDAELRRLLAACQPSLEPAEGLGL
ncbi:MAG: hypothetical protein J0I54_17825 [Bosea sp.]|uniref:hypothetical protein n=1 Tax=unclassified Bosea (in: a-proteobacteria) TaxID=2653178 RepID=UPI000967EDFF|nr:MULTISPECIES: hypothetical protein [unclassified Bosea (in: a-proteobacteria)]MBN9458493.1 hypothetical protein [Bosea sp. (in: a-proteobacteria)]OJV06805.1 MAG: hypothetical protein BGO20_00120 [Bosea sp. 67-29]